jgi:hypothetical protein
MPKHLILFVLAYSLYSTEVIEFILIYFLTGLCSFISQTLSAMECISIGDGAPWENAWIYEVT